MLLSHHSCLQGLVKDLVIIWEFKLEFLKFSRAYNFFLVVLKICFSLGFARMLNLYSNFVIAPRHMFVILRIVKVLLSFPHLSGWIVKVCAC
jgi:hypothetical protein